MCGICGSTADPRGLAVAAMNAAMVHRGPDDEGRHVDSDVGVALGARRLAIIDVAKGHQPIANEDGTVWAVLNGEIYNHPALRRSLRDGGHRLATACDTEVLVHLYEDYGDGLVHALEGMYAFAIWDARRRRLLLGRDRFGEKPLFYAERHGDLTFASELTALLASGALPPDLAPAAFDAYFVFGYVPGPDSIVKGVRQLPPGHVLAWEAGRGGGDPVPYWQPPEPPMSAPAPSEPIAEVRVQLEASVRARMISDVPLGVFLSGGIDSALVAALAARAATGPIRTFTVGYDVGHVSEVGAARRIAAALGTEHHELTLTGRDIADAAPALLSALDQPIADPALVALHAVAAFAREHVTVAIGGEGADELFGGYPRYRWLHRAQALERVLPAAPATGAARMLRRVAGGSGRSGRIADVLEPRPSLERHLDWVTDRRVGLRAEVYGPALADALRGEGPIVWLREATDGLGGFRGLEDYMRLDQRHWLPDDVLAKADRATMRASLELRTPFLDRGLAEFAAGLPARAHAGRSGKRVLRAVLHDVLPSAGGRRKVAFRVPTADWLRGPLAAALDAQLEGGAIFAEGWLERACVAPMHRAHAAGAADWSHVLWPVLVAGRWLDRLRGVA